MVNHIRQHPQYAVLLACLIGLAVYFVPDFPGSINELSLLALVVGLAELVAVVAIPVALFRFLWLAGSRMKSSQR
jgi:hypothetical protein